MTLHPSFLRKKPKRQQGLAILTLLLIFSGQSLAQGSAADNAVNIDNITMNVVRGDVRHANRLPVPARGIIIDYMLENEDITVEEIDAIVAERKALRDELQTLRESGDREALLQRFAQLRQQGQLRREEVRAYIDNNEDLRDALVEELSQNAELRERLVERRQENRERYARIKERIKERREAAAAAGDGQ